MAAEHVAEGVAEHLVEDIVDIVEAGGPAPVHAVDPGVAETVVGGALLAVGQHRIGFVQLLELGFGVGAAPVAVGVVLHRELAERPLDLVVRGAAVDAQGLIIILRHLQRLAPLRTTLALRW